MTNTKEIKQVTRFLHEMYRLKNVLRFQKSGWEKAKVDRWESVAEHSWRFALMAALYRPYISEKINLEKTLKMILVEDIVEIIAEDYSPIDPHGKGGGHGFSDKAYATKFEREEAAAKEIFKGLPKKLRDEYTNLWREYAMAKLEPKKSTPESRYAYALDKIEAAMQIIDWNGGGVWTKERTEKSKKYVGEWTAYDPALKYVAKLLNSEMKKIEK